MKGRQGWVIFCLFFEGLLSNWLSLFPIADQDGPYGPAANHAPNENLKIDCFFNGIRTGAALLDELGRARFG